MTAESTMESLTGYFDIIVYIVDLWSEEAARVRLWRARTIVITRTTDEVTLTFDNEEE